LVLLRPMIMQALVSPFSWSHPGGKITGAVFLSFVQKDSPLNADRTQDVNTAGAMDDSSVSAGSPSYSSVSSFRDYEEENEAAAHSPNHNGSTAMDTDDGEYAWLGTPNFAANSPPFVAPEWLDADDLASLQGVVWKCCEFQPCRGSRSTQSRRRRR
jgi:hypothetical protein